MLLLLLLLGARIRAWSPRLGVDGAGCGALGVVGWVEVGAWGWGLLGLGLHAW